jgi:hypothetical protein
MPIDGMIGAGLKEQRLLRCDLASLHKFTRVNRNLVLRHGA